MNKNLSMSGKTVLISGSTNGIGKVAAIELAKKGAQVIIVGRHPQKTRQTVQEIKSISGNEAIDSLAGDLSSQAEIRRLALEFSNKYPRLDVLLNNAGAVFMKKTFSVDGIEMTFALNHLGYFLLTYYLSPLLEAGAPARVINVSSIAHLGARLNLEALHKDGFYNGWSVYGQSKLANLYFTYELARRRKTPGITVNALHPGFVATNFGKSNEGFFRTLFGLLQIGAVSPEKGAETSVYLASSPKVEDISGRFFARKKMVSSSKISYDRETARRLWQWSEQMTGISWKTSS